MSGFRSMGKAFGGAKQRKGNDVDECCSPSVAAQGPSREPHHLSVVSANICIMQIRGRGERKAVDKQTSSPLRQGRRAARHTSHQ